MLFKSIRIGLIANLDTLRRLEKLRIPAIFNIFLDLSRHDNKLLDKLPTVQLYIQIAGIYTRLSRLVRQSLLEKLKVQDDMTLLVEVDQPVRDKFVETLLYALSQQVDIIPILRLSGFVDTCKIAELEFVKELVLDYRQGVSPRSKLVKLLSYIRDYVNSLSRVKRITLGSVLGCSLPFNVELVRDFILASSTFYVDNSIDVLIQLVEVTTRRDLKLLYDTILRIYSGDNVQLDVPIE